MRNRHPPVAELRLEGANSRVHEVPLSVLATLFEALEEALLSIDEEQRNEGDAPPLVVTFHSFQSSSTIARASTSDMHRGRRAMRRWREAVRSGDIDDLPKRAVDATRRVQALHARGYRPSLREPDRKGTAVPLPPLDIAPEASAGALLSGTTTLYGEVLRVGGDTPKVRIRPLAGDAAIGCNLPPGDRGLAIARELGGRLYTTVGVRGVAQWDPATWTIQAFTIEDVTPYREAPLRESFRLLFEAAPHAWEDVEDVSAVIREMRADED